MPLRFEAGVLIIGSLDWDDDPSRKSWRASRLDPTRHFLAEAPIRYGRRSSTRGDTYTMVFSPSCEPGRAKVIPFRSRVNTAEDLICEAEHLWAAEDKEAQPTGKICAPWGCVALMVRPGAEIPQSVRDGWTHRTNREQNYGRFRQLPSEGAIVEAGMLRIPWPPCIDSGNPVPMDFLLATATNPTLDGSPIAYPSATTVAKAWLRADGQKYVEYFWNNRKSNIFTFEDDLIIQGMTAEAR